MSTLLFDSSNWSKSEKQTTGNFLFFGGLATMVIPSITLFIDFGISGGLNFAIQALSMLIGALMMVDGEKLINEAIFTPSLVCCG